MAENFATLDYKTQEETLTVIKHLTSILSTSGMQLIEVVSPSNLLAQLHEPQQQSFPNGTHVVVRRTTSIVGSHLSESIGPRSATFARIKPHHRCHENLGYNLYCDAVEISLEGVVWFIRGVSHHANVLRLETYCAPQQKM